MLLRGLNSLDIYRLPKQNALPVIRPADLDLLGSREHVTELTLTDRVLIVSRRINSCTEQVRLDIQEVRLHLGIVEITKLLRIHPDISSPLVDVSETTLDESSRADKVNYLFRRQLLIYQRRVSSDKLGDVRCNIRQLVSANTKRSELTCANLHVISVRLSFPLGDLG